MSTLDLGISGAKRATWRETDTRPLLQEIVANNPGADRAELFRLFWKEIEGDEDHLRSIVLYWFDLAMIALQRKPRSALGRTSRTETTTETIKQGIQARVKHEAKIMMLQLLQPNGKILGNCTSPDCRKIGGWVSVLADKVPANKTVAETLSEKQVYDIWKATNGKK